MDSPRTEEKDWTDAWVCAALMIIKTQFNITFAQPCIHQSLPRRVSEPHSITETSGAQPAPCAAL